MLSVVSYFEAIHISPILAFSVLCVNLQFAKFLLHSNMSVDPSHKHAEVF